MKATLKHIDCQYVVLLAIVCRGGANAEPLGEANLNCACINNLKYDIVPCQHISGIRPGLRKAFDVVGLLSYYK